MTDNVDSASIALDDIETIKRRQVENADALQVNNEAIIRTNLRVDALDRGQVEILRVLGEQAKAMAENTKITADVRDLMTFGKVGKRILVAVGSLCAALAGIASLYFSNKK